MAGTREDATLIVELGKWGAMIGVPEAARAIWADDFDPESAVANQPPVHPLLGWYETIGTLVKNGMLDRELVYDWLWVAGTGQRLGPAAVRAREQSVPQLYENFEAPRGWSAGTPDRVSRPNRGR